MVLVAIWVGRKVVRWTGESEKYRAKGNVSERFEWCQIEWSFVTGGGITNTDLLRSRRRPRRWDYRASRKSTNVIEGQLGHLRSSARGRTNLTSMDLGNGHDGRWGEE